MVAVVADFNTSVNHTVTARCDRAAVPADVFIHLISIVASLITRGIGLEPLAQNTVTATSRLAGVGARVGAHAVAVITKLTEIHTTVAAAL